jgi:hypothetical protein
VWGGTRHNNQGHESKRRREKGERIRKSSRGMNAIKVLICMYGNVLKPCTLHSLIYTIKKEKIII